MAIVSYLVIPVPGGADRLARRLAAIPGCDVVPVRDRELLLLVTETSSDDEELVLRDALAQVEGVHSMSLTFGELSR